MKKDKKVELSLKKQDVVDSELTLTDIIIELLRLETPKYSIGSLLKKQGATRTRIELAEHYLSLESAKLKQKSSKGKE
ncbi:hypothetical protein CEE45_05790 [Candidatus Heimdallarchaeota archaeon B3_Heim]|nr:MAG: hypothetical protein CEE45_05790 [Candidatus Heimdallarchaeota archaeon B3_Heim]